MKRTPIAGAASALFLAATLALGGCGGDPASISSPSSPSSPSSSSQPSPDSSVSSTAAPSSATTSADPTSRPDVEPFVIPDPVTGTYNGKTITMQYAAVTDYIYPGDNLRPTYFSNGYAGFHYYGKIGEEEHYVGGTFMDKTGKMICEPIYSNVAPFNSDGIALVIKQKKSGWPGGDGPWLYLDSTGTEKGECTEDPDIWLMSHEQKEEYTDGLKIVELGTQRFAIVNANNETVAELNDYREVYRIASGLIACIYDKDDYYGPYGQYCHLYDINGKLISETKFQRIGEFYNGLAPFWQDGKLGFLDDKGNIVIPATYPISLDMGDAFRYNDDLLLVNAQGRIAIVEIIRS